MALPVCSTTQISIAFDSPATREIQGRARTPAELPVRGPHTCVLNINRRTGSGSAARVSTNAIQSPSCRLHAHIIIQLRNQQVFLVRRNKLYGSLVTVDHLLQIDL